MDSLYQIVNGLVGNVDWGESLTVATCDFPCLNRLQYIRYIDEYIPKLQIHQQSLLTRKVFFQHNFQHWSSSLYQLDHLVICILSLLSLQVIFIL